MALVRPPLDTGKPLFARKEFLAGGRAFRPGQRFEWRRIPEISERRLRQMYDAGYLRHGAEQEEAEQES